jgi:hypothetical protein
MTRRANGKSKKDRPWYVVAADIRRVLKLRYPPEGYPVSDDALGRDRLRSYLDHKLLAGTDRISELNGIVSTFAPWMDEFERDRFVQRCIAQRQSWSGFELGNLFDLSRKERIKLRVWQMWPAGFTKEEAAQHRRTSKATYASQARQKRAAEEIEKSRTAYDNPSLNDHEKAVFGLLTASWVPSSKVKDELSTWPAYRHQDSSSMRQIISRALRKLEAKGLVQRRSEYGSRQQKIIFVCRSQNRASGCVSTPDCHRDTVTPPKSTSVVH